jgi:hypothetical protein
MSKCLLPVVSLAILLGVVGLCDSVVFQTHLLVGERPGSEPDFNQLDWIVDTNKPPWRIADLAARSVWGILGVAQILACLSTIAFAAYVIFKTCSRNTVVVLGIFLLAFIAGTAYFSFREWICGIRIYFPGTLIREAALRTHTRLAPIEFGLAFGNMLAIVVVVTAAIAIICLCCFRYEDRSVSTLRDRVAQLRWLLTLSSSTLTAAVFQIGAQYRWPAALMEHESDSEWLLNSFAVTAAFVNGMFFSLQILALFIPAAFILHRRVESLVPLGQDIAHWRAAERLDISPGQMFLDVSKTVWPMLAALPFSIFKS